MYYNTCYTSPLLNKSESVSVLSPREVPTFFIFVHCVTHRTNLVTLTLSNLPIVVKIEALLASVYTYFNHSPKRNLERSKLAKVMETKGFKILCNIKTRWISMVAFSKVVLEEFKILLVKMAKMLLLMSLQLLTMNCYVTLRLLWGILVYCLCWKLYKVWANMLKTKRSSFVTLWVVWSFVKLTYTTRIVMKYNYSGVPQFQNFIDHTFDPLHNIWWNNLIFGV